MASNDSLHVSYQQGIEKHIQHYFDIMMIGKTGMGKSTTADKLLIANPYGEPYLGAQDEEPIRDDDSGCIQHSDMYMWHLSDEEDEIERVSRRLKNLVFYRSLENPHEEVKSSRTNGTYGSTHQCELLSNDSTQIRVLDVPGFYGSEAASAGNVCDRAVATANTDLSTMRKIFHIKTAKKFRFNRVVYFLPETGALVRHSQVLQTEIGIMESYFGRSIFESMVVVATYPASAYKFFNKDHDLFPSEDYEKTRHYFQKAMVSVFGSEDVPQPPIIFVSLFDTCEEVYSKIKESKVSHEGVELEFNPFTCARCNIKIGSLKEGVPEDHKDGLMATCTHDDWSSAIPYEDSTCHPMMLPKYSKIQKIVGGIAHLITFKLFLGKWPSFRSLDEICIKCGDCPKSRGCHKVRTKYVHSTGSSIDVDHTNVVAESFEIKIESECDYEESETAAYVGTGLTLDSERGHYAPGGADPPQHSGQIQVRDENERGTGDGGEGV